MNEIQTITVETEEAIEERIQQWRLIRALQEAPDLIAHVRGQAISGRVDRGEVLREQTAPVLLSPLSDSDSVYAQLIDWVMNIAGQLRLAPPSLTVVAWNLFDPDNAKDDFRGFRAGTTAAAAHLLTGIQTLWLIGHRSQIETWSGYREFRDDVTDMLWSLRSRYPMEERTDRATHPRKCPLCDEPNSVTAHWWTDDTRDVLVQCGTCGFTIDTPTQILDWLDWDTKENRQCTCRYPGDPSGTCPTHHPKKAPTL